MNFGHSHIENTIPKVSPNDFKFLEVQIFVHTEDMLYTVTPQT